MWEEIDNGILVNSLIYNPFILTLSISSVIIIISEP